MQTGSQSENHEERVAQHLAAREVDSCLPRKIVRFA